MASEEPAIYELVLENEELSIVKLRLRCEAGPFSEDERKELEAKCEVLKAKLKGHDLSLKELASTAGLGRWYKSLYRLASGPTHATIRSLREYYAENGVAIRSGSGLGPRDTGIERNVLTVTDFLLRATKIVGRRVNLEAPAGWEEIDRRYRVVAQERLGI